MSVNNPLAEYLLKVFDETAALDPVTKETIRHRIWARLNESPWPFPGSNADAFVVVGGIVVGPLMALALVVLWSMRYGALRGLGSLAIALLLWGCAFFATSEQGLGRFIKYGPALYLIMIAMSVLGIRTLPLVANRIPGWTNAGFRAGFVGTIATLIGLTLAWIVVGPLLHWIEDRSRWSQNPEGHIVTTLLHLLDDLRQLENIRNRRDEFIQETIARNKRRSDLLRQLAENNAAGVSTREATEVSNLADGTFLESYQLEVQRDDGSWETKLHEERVSSTPNSSSEDPRWRTTRQKVAHHVEELARYIELGLPAKLSVGDARLDAWLRVELRGRAQTIRNWAQRVILPHKSGYEDLISQVGATLEHSSEEQWAAIVKSEVPAEHGIRQRLFRFARNASAGVVPLGAVAAAPAMGVLIPPALLDSVLTFAVPWTLLQLLELAIPHASDYLSRSKEIREMLPDPIGKALGK